AGAVPTRRIPEVDDDLRTLAQVSLVDGAVPGGDHDAVVALGRVFDGPEPVEIRDVRVVIRHLGAALAQQLDDLLRGRLAHVVDVRLVRHAEDQDPRALERLLRTVVQRLRYQR